MTDFDHEKSVPYKSIKTLSGELYQNIFPKSSVRVFFRKPEVFCDKSLKKASCMPKYLICNWFFFLVGTQDCAHVFEIL